MYSSAAHEEKSHHSEKHIIDTLTSLGLIKIKESLSLIDMNSTENTNRSSASELTRLKNRIINQIIKNLSRLKNNKSFIFVVNAILKKSKEFTCPSILKLILYCDNAAKIEKVHKELILATQLIESNINTDKENNVLAVLGYIISLNLNKYSYSKIWWFSLHNNFLLINNVKQHTKHYIELYQANELALQNPQSSKKRRELLRKSDLLESHLQRDDEEVAIYEKRMLTAQDDKARLLEDMTINQLVSIIDVGPAGGAIFKSAASFAFQMRDRKISYYGIELDKHEFLNLTALLNNPTYDDMSPKQFFDSAAFIQGNAIELYRVLNESPDFNHHQHRFLLIILCSVIHEIYSYCQNNNVTNRFDDMATMTNSIDGKYNLESVYQVYKEALMVLKENESGSLNIRDGVMYRYPDEMVTFTLNSELWIALFNAFLQDNKYAHLKHAIKKPKQGEPITLPAKYVQEFMLKANWGARSFGNEINEVYCYLTLENHKKLIHKAATDLDLKIDIAISEEYTQQGYQQHITDKDISILSGFGKERFPPTNMRLKINLIKHENHFNLRQSAATSPLFAMKNNTKILSQTLTDEKRMTFTG